MRRAWVVLLGLWGCESVPPANGGNGLADGGVVNVERPPDGDAGGGGADAGFDAGIDAGPQLIEPRDAGPIIEQSAIPWTWPMAETVISRSPADGGVRTRWVELESPAPARAWAGGVLLQDGGVVAIPFSASSVLFIDPAHDRTERWRIDGGGVSEGWQGGVLLPDGTVIGIPRQANRFLRIDPAARTAAPFGDELPPLTSDAGVVLGRFRGGVLGHNGLVYASPAGVNYIARLDPATGAVTRIPIPPQRPQGDTHGAVLFPTGDIVMLSLGDFPGLLVIPSRDGGADEVWMMPRPAAPGAPAFTGGGVLTGRETALAAPQQNAYPVHLQQGLYAWGTPVSWLQTQSANSYFFGAWSTDGYCYFPPFGSGPVLRMDATGRSEAIDAGPPSFRSMFGAVGLPDGRVLGIPHDRSAYLEILPEGATPAPLESMTSPFLNKL